MPDTKINIVAMVMFFLFSLIVIFTIAIKVWPFVAVSFFFQLYFLFQIKHDKKISGVVNFTIYFFFIIFIYILLQYFAIFGNKNVWYHDNIVKTAQLFDSNFITLIVISLYAIFTYMMFSEMKRSREFIQRPRIIGRPEQHGEWFSVDFVIRNVGQASAYDVEADIIVITNENEKKKNKWIHSLFESNEKINLNIEDGGIKTFFEKNKKLIFKVEYKDYEGKPYEEYREFDLKKLLEGIENCVWLIEKDYNYRINKHLEKISKSLEKIEKYNEYLSYESKLNYNKKEEKRMAKYFANMKDRPTKLKKLKEDIKKDLKLRTSQKS